MVAVLTHKLLGVALLFLTGAPSQLIEKKVLDASLRSSLTSSYERVPLPFPFYLCLDAVSAKDPFPLRRLIPLGPPLSGGVYASPSLFLRVSYCSYFPSTLN